MTYSDAIRFLYGLRWFGAKFGLANTFKLAALAGNPQNRLRFIHVAGTNGKGSTCAMLESIYRAAGLRVGLFTSPHLVAFGERIQVNRQRHLRARYCAARRGDAVVAGGRVGHASTHAAPSPARRLRRQPRGPEALRSAAAEHPTFFEVVTVMALRYFAAQKCDLVIWETGLGGRLDATNIVAPLASVITNIQYDHQKWLGETLASIAAEKAGIIKPGIPVITATDGADALQVITETARRQDAPLTTLSPAEMHHPPLNTLQLPLLGQHQRMNAAVAVATVRALASQIPVSDDTIRAGLSRVHWAGRLQLVTRPTGPEDPARRRPQYRRRWNTGGRNEGILPLGETHPGARHPARQRLARHVRDPRAAGRAHPAGAGAQRAQRHAAGTGGGLPARQSGGAGR